MKPDTPLLGRILAEVQRIRQGLEGRRARASALSRTDRENLTKLLPAIVGALGSELFLVRDLFQSDAPALRLVLADWNALRLGRLLRRAEGHAIDGHMVQCEGHELGAALWRVVPFP